MKEKNFYGAIPLNTVHRRLRKMIRPKLVSGFGFDWTKGFDVRDTIGAISIKNQGDNYSCGGEAGSYFLEVQRRLQGKNEGDISAKSIYSPIAYEGGGTTITKLMTQIGAHGANLEKDVPSYDLKGNPLTEASIRDTGWETKALLDEALSRAGYTPWDIGEGIDEVAATIRDYGAVIWEVAGINNGTWTSSYPQPLKTGQTATWNHFMCAIGAKMINGKKTIIALQSMGTSWGEQGIQYFTDDFFNSKSIVDCFTFVYDEKLVPIPGQINIWTELCRWFRWQWGLAQA